MSYGFVKNALFKLKDSFLKEVNQLKDGAVKFKDVARGQHSYTLKNGIALNVQARHGKHITIDVKFSAGHHNDPEDKHVGHLLEHMVGRRFNNAEGDNASITQNATYYDLRFLADKGPKALNRFLGDIRRKLFSTEFNAEDVDREKRIVLITERAVRNRGKTSDWEFNFAKTVMNDWKQHSADTEENLERTNVQDLQDFMNAHYVGHKMSITIKGPVNPLQMLYAVQDTFGDVPAGETTPAPASVTPDYEHGEYIYPDQNMELLDYTIGLVVPDEFHEKEALKTFMTQYIWLSSMNAFRERGNQTLYTANTKLCFHENMQFLLLHGEVLPQHAHKVLPAYAQILSDMTQGRIDPENFEITRDICLHDGVDKWVTAKDIRRVKPDDLAQMMRAMLNDGRISLIKQGIALDNMKLEDFKNLLTRASAPEPSEDGPDQAILIPS